MRLFRRYQPYEFDALATYNAERARGIMHTPEWQAKMAADKQRFDAKTIAEARAAGHLIYDTETGTLT